MAKIKFQINDIEVVVNREVKQMINSMYSRELAKATEEASYSASLIVDSNTEIVLSIPVRGMRKHIAEKLGYDDRNDGFERTSLSRSKWNHSRNTKEGKVIKTKAPHKIYNELDEAFIEIEDREAEMYAMMFEKYEEL